MVGVMTRQSCTDNRVLCKDHNEVVQSAPGNVLQVWSLDCKHSANRSSSMLSRTDVAKDSSCHPQGRRPLNSSVMIPDSYHTCCRCAC